MQNRTTLPSKTEQKPSTINNGLILSEKSLLKVSEKSGVGLTRLEVIAKGNINPVRRMNGADFAAHSIVTIGKTAEAYCGVNPMDEGNRGAIKECARLLKNKFPEMGLNEIDEAFSMAAAQLLDVSLTAFGGRFTVAMFGAVLSAYKTFRNNVLVQMSKVVEMEAEELEQVVNEKRNAEYRAHVISEFQNLQWENKRIETPEQIPSVWAKILKEEELINSNTALWLQAKQQVCLDFLRDVANGEFSILIGNSASCRKLADKIKTDPEYFPMELKPAAEILYGRWIVFSNLAPYQPCATS